MYIDMKMLDYYRYRQQYRSMFYTQVKHASDMSAATDAGVLDKIECLFRSHRIYASLAEIDMLEQSSFFIKRTWRPE